MKNGPPDPAFPRKLLNVLTKGEHKESRQGMLWQAIRDSIYYTEGPGRLEDHDEGIWYGAVRRNQERHPVEVAAFRAELAQHGWDALMAFDWTKTKTVSSQTPPALEERKVGNGDQEPRLITQADIDAARRKRAEES